MLDRPQLFVPLPNNPLATWLQENSADVDDSKAGTLRDVSRTLVNCACLLKLKIYIMCNRVGHQVV